MTTIQRAIAAARAESTKRSGGRSPGQQALLRNLAGRGMPEFYGACRAAGCTPVEAEQLHEDGLVIIEGNDDENDPSPVIYITEAGKEAARS